MNLLNVGSIKLGARILHASSTQNQVLHAAKNILDENKQSIWSTQEGLPQSVIIAFDLVRENYQNICSIGVYCEHDYQTNPKVIELWVSNTIETVNDDQFIFWQDIILKKKSGMQIFNLDSIPESYRFIKLIITETFGEYQTYINQVMFFAEPDAQSTSSLFNHQQWQQLQKQNAYPYKPASSPPNMGKTYPKHILNKQQQQLQNYLGIDGQSPIHHIQSHKHHTKTNLSYENNQQEGYTNQHQRFTQENNYGIDRKKYKKSRKQYDMLKLKDLEYEGEIQRAAKYQQHPQYSSLHASMYGEQNQNKGMFIMSRNLQIMQQNMEDLNRKLEVLEIKVDTAYQSLQKKILYQVQQIVQKQITKQLSQKNLFQLKSKQMRKSDNYTPYLKQQQEYYNNDKKQSHSKQIGTSRVTKKVNIPHKKYDIDNQNPKNVTHMKKTKQSMMTNPQKQYEFQEEYYEHNHETGRKTANKDRVKDLFIQIQMKLDQRARKVKQLQQRQSKHKYRKKRQEEKQHQPTDQYYRR